MVGDDDFGENFVFVLGSYDTSPSSSFVTISLSKPAGVDKVNRWTRNATQRREHYYFDALAFSGQNINLVFDEETMKPGRLTKAPENAGIDPSTMKMKNGRRNLAIVMFLSFRLPVARAVQELPLERTEHPIRDGNQLKLTKRGLLRDKGDMPSLVPERVANPRIREDRAVQDFQRNSGKMHCATYEDANTRAWFDYCRNVFPQSVRKTGPNVDLYNVSTYQCSILFNNMGSFNRKSEFRKAENMDKPVSPHEKFNVTNDPQLSHLKEFWGNNYAHVILTAEADSLPTDREQLPDDYGLVRCHSSRSDDLSVHARINSTGCVRLLWESKRRR